MGMCTFKEKSTKTKRKGKFVCVGDCDNPSAIGLGTIPCQNDHPSFYPSKLKLFLAR